MSGRVMAAVVVAALGVSLMTSSVARAESLVFAGSGANLAATRALAEVYARKHGGAEIQVPPSIDSGGGIRAVADGAIAVALISRPLQNKERELGLTVVPYARTAVVIGVHPTVADDNVTKDELAQIYAGRKTRWANGREIVVLTREPGDSTIQILEQQVPGFKEAFADSYRAKRWPTMFTDQEMAQTLRRTPYAIGFTDVGALTAEHLPIKPLKVDGVVPTADRYPFAKVLAFAYFDNRLSPEAKRFIEFALGSEGAKILATKGYLPGAPR